MLLLGNPNFVKGLCKEMESSYLLNFYNKIRKVLLIKLYGVLEILQLTPLNIGILFLRKADWSR